MRCSRSADGLSSNIEDALAGAQTIEEMLRAKEAVRLNLRQPSVAGFGDQVAMAIGDFSGSFSQEPQAQLSTDVTREQEGAGGSMAQDEGLPLSAEPKGGRAVSTGGEPALLQRLLAGAPAPASAADAAHRPLSPSSCTWTADHHPDASVDALGVTKDAGAVPEENVDKEARVESVASSA
eukprot:2977032-Prymnesium_polylepis.1